MGKRRGRKNKYEVYVKPNFGLIEEWARTMTEEQIARKLGIAYSTFNDYKVKHPELTEVLKKGKQDLVSDLHSALVKRAKGYQYTETKVTTSKVKFSDDQLEKLFEAGFTMDDIDGLALVKTEIAHKEMAPDVAALNLALKNYDRDNWANDPQMLDIRKKELELRERQIENNEW